MNTAQQIALHLRAVFFGGNWTSVNYQAELAAISWQQAIQPVHGFNTIATLLHHTVYYVHAVADVLNGQPLTAKDSLSFAHPPIASAADWDNMVQQSFAAIEAFAKQIEQVPEALLPQTFIDEKYGNYYRNLSGIVEHFHYHLGQIVLLKKLLATA
jgi:uncharacterized damage-inducible protein DinB